MAKIKYDVSDAPTGTDFDTPVPKGLYRCKVNDVTEGESKSSGKPMLTVEYEITQKGDWKGRRLWDYIVLDDSSAWKLRQFVEAIGKRAKGTLDTEAAVGERVMVRVKHETDDRDPDNPVVRARVGNVTAVPDATTAEDDEDEADDDDGADTGGDEDDLTLEDLEGYTRDELEELIEDEELEVKFNAKTKDAVLVQRVAEALGLEEEDEDDDDEDAEAADYDEWNLADLKTEAKARGLSTKGPKSKLVARLEEDDEDGSDPF